MGQAQYIVQEIIKRSLTVNLKAKNRHKRVWHIIHFCYYLRIDCLAADKGKIKVAFPAVRFIQFASDRYWRNHSNCKLMVDILLNQERRG